MKILHILKTEPDQTVRTLLDITSEGHEVTVFNLYEKQSDCEALIDLIFEHDKVITWW